MYKVRYANLFNSTGLWSHRRSFSIKTTNTALTMLSFNPPGLGGTLLFDNPKPKIIRGNMSPRLEALARPGWESKTPRAEDIETTTIDWHYASPRSRPCPSRAQSRRELKHRAELKAIGFFPSGSPRIAQSGSIAYDRWRLQRDQVRDKQSIQLVRPGTDSWAPAAWYQYQHLITHNPKGEYLKAQADQKAQREIQMAKQRVRESVSHYKVRGSWRKDAISPFCDSAPFLRSTLHPTYSFPPPRFFLPRTAGGRLRVQGGAQEKPVPAGGSPPRPRATSTRECANLRAHLDGRCAAELRDAAERLYSQSHRIAPGNERAMSLHVCRI